MMCGSKLGIIGRCIGSDGVINFSEVVLKLIKWMFRNLFSARMFEGRLQLCIGVFL